MSSAFYLCTYGSDSQALNSGEVLPRGVTRRSRGEPATKGALSLLRLDAGSLEPEESAAAKYQGEVVLDCRQNLATVSKLADNCMQVVATVQEPGTTPPARSGSDLCRRNANQAAQHVQNLQCQVWFLSPARSGCHTGPDQE
eukprot:4979521-Amphidinium_carterae.1